MTLSLVAVCEMACFQSLSAAKADHSAAHASALAATLLAKAGISMERKNWAGVQLPGADLRRARLGGTILSGANLEGASLAEAFVHDVDFTEANLEIDFDEDEPFDFNNALHTVISHPSKPWLLIGAESGLCVVNFENRQVLWEEEHESHFLSFGAAGKQVLTSNFFNGALQLWGVNESGALSQQAHLVGSGHVSCCAFSSNGERIVVGNRDGTLRVWRVAPGLSGEVRPQTVFKVHEGGVLSCALSPDGERLVSGGGDNMLRVWRVDTASGHLKQQAVLPGHRHPVTFCAFSPNGKQLVSGSSLNLNGPMLRLWAVPTGSPPRLQALLQGGASLLQSCAFNSGGTHIIAGVENGSVYMWRITLDISRDLYPDNSLKWA